MNRAPAPDATTTRGLLLAILAELQGIRRVLDRSTAAQQPSSRPIAEKHMELVAALVVVVGKSYDVPFETSEVFGWAAADERLSTALERCGVERTLELGYLFRGLVGRDLGGVQLCRDGRSWRFEPLDT
jgi:hypothetical protein